MYSDAGATSIPILAILWCNNAGPGKEMQCSPSEQHPRKHSLLSVELCPDISASWLQHPNCQLPHSTAPGAREVLPGWTEQRADSSIKNTFSGTWEGGQITDCQERSMWLNCMSFRDSFPIVSLRNDKEKVEGLETCWSCGDYSLHRTFWPTRKADHSKTVLVLLLLAFQKN